MKEKILNAFKTHGFALEEVGDAGYHFDYEGLHFLWLTNDDENFLNIVIPNVAEKDDMDDEITYYRLMDMINSKMKYVKANTVNGFIWLCYERELIDETHIDEVIRHMIVHLEQSYHMMGSNEEQTDDEDLDDTAVLIDDIEFADDNNETTD